MGAVAGRGIWGQGGESAFRPPTRPRRVTAVYARPRAISNCGGGQAVAGSANCHGASLVDVVGVAALTDRPAVASRALPAVVLVGALPLSYQSAPSLVD